LQQLNDVNCVCCIALDINSTNWYQHLKITEVNEEIRKIISKFDRRNLSEDKLSEINLLINKSPLHGQLIVSQPSKDGHLASQNAEIIIEVTRSLKNTYCLK